MGWGDTLSNAWNSATETARNAANVIVETAQAAYNWVVDRVNEAIEAVSNFADRVINGVISAFRAIYDAFGRIVGGSAVQPCPLAGSGAGGQSCGDDPGGSTEPPPPVEDYNIVSVDWLNGDDVTVIGACDQYVNLPRDAKWLADSDIPNIDRLSINPRLLVKFDIPISAGFRYRIVPIAGGSPAYTATEEARNGNFKASPSDWSAGSVSDGQGIIEAQLVAGGGYNFQVEAKDDKEKVVTSGIITTKRLFWYVELPMSGLANALNSTASLEAEFAKYHMIMKQLPDLTVPRQENIGDNSDSATLAANVQSAVAGSASASTKAPYLMRISYTDHLAVKNPNQRQRLGGVLVGPGQPPVAIGVAAAGLRVPNTVKTRSLWNDIVTGEGWFVSALYTPEEDGPMEIIDAAQVTSPDGGSSLQNLLVDVSGLPAGMGTIDVYVDVVDRMRAGIALGGAANICVCTRCWWSGQSNLEQAGTVIHEAGHIVHMVVSGTGNQPNRVATQYDDAGHVGSHCRSGAPAGEADYSTGANVALSTCVMFGTINGRTAFCGNCGPAVTKVDIGDGF